MSGSAAATHLPTRPATDVPVTLNCHACGDHIVVYVATHGALAALTRDQQDLVDEFALTHDGVVVAPPR